MRFRQAILASDRTFAGLSDRAKAVVCAFARFDKGALPDRAPR